MAQDAGGERDGAGSNGLLKEDEYREEHKMNCMDKTLKGEKLAKAIV